MQKERAVAVVPEEEAEPAHDEERGTDEVVDEESVPLVVPPLKRDCFFWRNWIGFFLLGTINNLSYVVVGSAAQSISESFHKENLIGLIGWANICFGFVARGMNTFLLERVDYWIRVLLTIYVMTIGLYGVAVSQYINFWFAIAAIILVGSASSFGESVMLGYMRRFPAETVDGWSSGTGMAGVSGTLLYIAFTAGGLKNWQSFLLLIPFGFAYWLVYGFLVKKAKNWEAVNRMKAAYAKQKEATVEEEEPLLESVQVPPMANLDNEEPPIIEGGFRRNWRCLKLVWWRALQLLLVYMFEYIVCPGAADKATADLKDSSNWFEANGFVILNFCYQIGVLISRSSLSLVKIRRIEILTILQLLNLVLWLFEAKFLFMNIWVQFVSMVFVGLLGGAMYVNTFYLLLNDPKIPEQDKELCVNWTALAQTAGITSASLFTLFMDNTFLK
ncbi:Batten's disease protein Cln3 [Balamuthia mandrillaris]